MNQNQQGDFVTPAGPVALWLYGEWCEARSIAQAVAQIARAVWRLHRWVARSLA